MHYWVRLNIIITILNRIFFFSIRQQVYTLKNKMPIQWNGRIRVDMKEYIRKKKKTNLFHDRERAFFYYSPPANSGNKKAIYFDWRVLRSTEQTHRYLWFLVMTKRMGQSIGYVLQLHCMLLWIGRSIQSSPASVDRPRGEKGCVYYIISPYIILQFDRIEI